MNDSNISSLIKLLNLKKNLETVFLRPISDSVDFALVWMEYPKLEVNANNFNEGPYRFYFIKDANKEYVGAVLDMSQDLHGFIEGKHRRKGYLEKALNEYILEDLFRSRKRQRITINKRALGPIGIASEKVALKTGFKKTGTTHQGAEEYELCSLDFKSHATGDPYKVSPISEERLKTLQRRINYAKNLLLIVSNEMEIKYLNDGNLESVAETVGEYKWKLDDIYSNHRFITVGPFGKR